MHHIARMTSNDADDLARGERIKFIRTQLSKTQDEFAALLSRNGHPVTRGAVGNWERGKNIGIDSMTAICKIANVPLDWLAYNKGAKPAVGQQSARRPLIASFDPFDESDVDFGTLESGYSHGYWRPSISGSLPEVDGKLGAGEGSVGDVVSVPFSSGSISGHRVVAEWVIPLPYLQNEAKASPADTIIMEVIGDSMQPSYMPGDRVLVDLSQRRFVTDTVYAISDGYAEPQIKRLQRVPFSSPTQVRIISDNPALETFTVELDRLTIIGRICGHIARK